MLQTSMPYLRTVISCAIIMCSIFFGSGNMVLPFELINRYGPTEAFNLLLGFCIASPGLSVAGVIIMSKVLNSENFLSPLGRASKPLSMILISLMGPLAIVPRCITVSHGSIIPVYNISPAIFCALFCLILALVVIKRQYTIKFLGNFLSPVKLIVLTITMILICLKLKPNLQFNSFNKDSFFSGLTMGYQTGDLISSVFKSTIMREYLSYYIKDRDVISFQMMISALLGGLLMLLLYLCVFYISSSGYHIFHGQPANTALSLIMGDLFAKYGMIFNIVTTCLLCLVTAVSLVVIWCDMIYSATNINYNAICVFAVTASYLIAAFIGFNGIIRIFGIVTKILYPLFIAIMIYHFFCLREKEII